ncbi:MAG: TolC family protein [Bacteroidales bacterium]|nr:TolC family protein [Bacteroidales bacterium]
MKYLIIFILSVQVVFAQNIDTLNIFQCYDLAIKNYPISKQKEYFINSNNLKIKNISAKYLPQINMSGQATYQSDVTRINVELPFQLKIDIDEPTKDQYKISLDVNQVLFDGGLNKSQKKVENANLNVNIQQVEVKLYKLKEQINKVYFNILLLQETETALKIMNDEIVRKLNIVESGIKNGILLQSNADILKAELLKIEQNIIEINMNKQASINILAELISYEIKKNTYIKLPKIIINDSIIKNRPELTLFEMNKTKLDVYSGLLSKKKMPMLYGFGQLGYGRPGLNMLSNEFDPYYIFGAKLNWNIWDWRQTNREKQILEINKNIIDSEKETFNKNKNIAIQNEDIAITKYNYLIEKDNQIILLRNNITKEAAAQLENGIITSTDYLEKLNAEIQAKINLETHKIQLVKAKIDYLTVKGF